MSESNNIEINEIKPTEATEIKPKRKPYKKRKDIGIKRVLVPKPRSPETAWRHNPDGTYNNNPSSESYFRDYYHKKLSGISICPFCNKEGVTANMLRHQKSNKCKKIQALKE